MTATQNGATYEDDDDEAMRNDMSTFTGLQTLPTKIFGFQAF